MWSEHIRNKQAVQNVFGSNVPALEGLELMQLVLDGVGGLDVALNLEQLPDGAGTLERARMRLRTTQVPVRC